MAAKKKSAKKTLAKKPAKKPAKTAAKKKPAKKAKKKVSPIPKGYHSVTTAMNQNDASATIEFCRKAFGAKTRMMMQGADGKLMHAEITIGDSVIMLSDSVIEPARVGGAFLYVKDVDATIASAVAAGAKVLSPAEDTFWGDRFGRVKDPYGNFWAIATHVEDVTPAQMRKRMAAEEKKMAAGGAQLRDTQMSGSDT